MNGFMTTLTDFQQQVLVVLLRARLALTNLAVAPRLKSFVLSSTRKNESS